MAWLKGLKGSFKYIWTCQLFEMFKENYLVTYFKTCQIWHVARYYYIGQLITMFREAVFKTGPVKTKRTKICNYES